MLAPTQPILAPYGATRNYDMINVHITTLTSVHKTYYLFNMHQTMTAKDYQDRGTINRINRQQHPPHRKFRVY
jgi:hypothetical protein